MYNECDEKMENLKAKNLTANAHPKTNVVKELTKHKMPIFFNLYLYTFTNAKEYNLTKLLAYHIHLDKTGTSSSIILYKKGYRM